MLHLMFINCFVCILILHMKVWLMKLDDICTSTYNWKNYW